jgi:hypothetical protein
MLTAPPLVSTQKESEFLSNPQTKPRVQMILASVHQRLNNFGSCHLQLDDSNYLSLQLRPLLPPPPEIQLHQVPILVRDIKSKVSKEWDFALQMVRKSETQTKKKNKEGNDYFFFFALTISRSCHILMESIMFDLFHDYLEFVLISQRKHSNICSKFLHRLRFFFKSVFPLSFYCLQLLSSDSVCQCFSLWKRIHHHTVDRTID